MTTLRGSCLCEAIRFECGGTPSVLCLCHCTICRRSVGATPVAWATFPRAAFRVIAGDPVWHRSSETARRGFCSRCGSSLFFQSDRASDEIDVTIACMEEADALVPDRHIWTPSKLGWVRTDDGLPCHVRDAESPVVTADA